MEFFLDQCNMSFLERKNCHLGWFDQVKLGTKKPQKINKKKGEISRLSKLACAEKPCFMILYISVFVYIVVNHSQFNLMQNNKLCKTKRTVASHVPQLQHYN